RDRAGDNENEGRPLAIGAKRRSDRSKRREERPAEVVHARHATQETFRNVDLEGSHPQDAKAREAQTVYGAGEKGAGNRWDESVDGEGNPAQRAEDVHSDGTSPDADLRDRRNPDRLAHADRRVDEAVCDGAATKNARPAKRQRPRA